MPRPILPTLLLVLCACGSARHDVERTGDPPPSEMPGGEPGDAADAANDDPGAERPAYGQPRPLGEAPWPADQGIGVESNGGRYWVVYIPSQSEIPLNEEFDVELRVYDGATRSRLVDAEVAVDARMPAHGHGMKIDARPIPNPDGSYAVPGMLLHMVGHWELYVDLTVGPITERAQFDIELE